MSKLPSLEKIVARDGPDCHWCHRFVEPEHRTREHLIPLSAGGTNVLTNLVMACHWCNHDRSSIPAEMWRAAMDEALASGSVLCPSKVARRLIGKEAYASAQIVAPGSSTA